MARELIQMSSIHDLPLIGEMVKCSKRCVVCHNQITRWFKSSASPSETAISHPVAEGTSHLVAEGTR